MTDRSLENWKKVQKLAVYKILPNTDRIEKESSLGKQ